MLSNTHFSMAVHVLVALAYNKGQVVGSADLGKTVGTNPSFLRGLIGQLKEAGLVETQMGKGGGARLARPAAKITLQDIYRATETQPALKMHGCDSSSPCPVARGMQEVLDQVSNRIETAVASELKQTTVASLLAKYIVQ